MRKLLVQSSATIGFVLLSPVALADTQEDLQATVIKMAIYAVVAFVVVVAILVYFMRSRDKRQSPLNKLFEHGEPIHAVAPDTPVTECARIMTAKKIGAVVVMDGERMTGIFTERDALTKVLAAGLDPRQTKISAVMTKDPYCIPPTTTVGEAMQLITERRFRHLPVVENGKLLAVVSSGDLTHWLVQDKLGDVRELVDLAAQS